MADPTEICNKIDCCVGEGRSVKDSDFKVLALQLLCCLVTESTSSDDFEIVCASTDGRPLQFNTTTGELTELGGAAIADGATAVACDKEYKTTERCYQDITDNTIRYTQLLCYEIGNPTNTTTVWIDGAGAVLPSAPANIEPCLETIDKSGEQAEGEVCYNDGGQIRTAIRVMQKDTLGNFTGVIRFIDGVTGALVNSADIVDCPVPIITSVKNCVV